MVGIWKEDSWIDVEIRRKGKTVTAGVTLELANIFVQREFK